VYISDDDGVVHTHYKSWIIKIRCLTSLIEREAVHAMCGARWRQ